jgi:hypothetical protein
MAYERLPIVTVADPDKPGDFLIINQADWRDNATPAEYAAGLAFHPDRYPLYEPPVPRAPKPAEGKK